jgi:hypothetical protein
MVALTLLLTLYTLRPALLLVFKDDVEVSRERDSQIFWRFSKVFCSYFMGL